MSTNKLQVINKGDAVDFNINQQNADHLIASLEQFERDNARFPEEIIMSEATAHKYLSYFKQGVPFRVLYKNRPLYITVNIRLHVSDFIIK